MHWLIDTIIFAVAISFFAYLIVKISNRKKYNNKQVIKLLEEQNQLLREQLNKDK